MTDERYNEICLIMIQKKNPYKYCKGSCKDFANSSELNIEEWKHWKSLNKRKITSKILHTCQDCK